MSTQFRNFDAPNRPQQVSIKWERKLIDDDSGDMPDDNDDGFWPSLDPEEAGYIGDDPTDVTGDKQQARYDELSAAAQARYDSFGDSWNFVGVVAVAHISIPIGGGSFATYTLSSPGLWGVESDAGDYLDTVYEDQKAELLSHLKMLAAGFAGDTIIEEG